MNQPVDYRDTDAPQPVASYCTVCNQVLTFTALYDPVFELPTAAHIGDVQSTFYRHATIEDHDPVPAPLTSLEGISQVCDFCHADEVVGWALATPFKVLIYGFENRDNGLWACCSTCRDFLAARKGNALINHCLKGAIERHGPDAEEPLRALQEAFLHHFTGEITTVIPTF